MASLTFALVRATGRRLTFTTARWPGLLGMALLCLVLPFALCVLLLVPAGASLFIQRRSSS